MSNTHVSTNRYPEIKEALENIVDRIILSYEEGCGILGKLTQDESMPIAKFCQLLRNLSHANAYFRLYGVNPNPYGLLHCNTINAEDDIIGHARLSVKELYTDVARTVMNMRLGTTVSIKEVPPSGGRAAHLWNLSFRSADGSLILCIDVGAVVALADPLLSLRPLSVDYIGERLGAEAMEKNKH